MKEGIKGLTDQPCLDIVLGSGGRIRTLGEWPTNHKLNNVPQSRHHSSWPERNGIRCKQQASQQA